MVALLQTSYPGAAKFRAAMMCLALAPSLATRRRSMLDDQRIDGQIENAAAKLVRAAFVLGHIASSAPRPFGRGYLARASSPNAIRTWVC